MGRARKQAGKRSKARPPRAPSVDGAGAEPRRAEAGGEDQEAQRGKGRRFWARRPVLRFILVFGVLMVLFYTAYYTPRSISATVAGVFDASLDLYAEASGTVLGILGDEVHVGGTSITSPRFSIRIVRGCDAVEATALFVCAVVAAPVGWRRRLVGILGGVVLLVGLNIVRIVSLYYIGIHFPNAFRAVHIDVWQPVFILVAVGLWLLWACWATRSRTERGDVSA
jgi:exosortase H (IPTLxxWG-CTERM-specific)